MKEQNLRKMKELVKILNDAGDSYYNRGQEIMSNYEYDRLYDELKELEETMGTVMSDSPTLRVGFEVMSELSRERHESPMLSLDKTKTLEDLESFLDIREGILSWKLDGITMVLTYNDGELKKAVTRGNGEVGEVVTPNARVFKNVPIHISFPGELVIRGEAIITYSDFERINREAGEAGAQYKNPRNLCSGSVRQLNPEVTAKRRVQFFAFQLVKARDMDFDGLRERQLKWMAQQGFTVVPYQKVLRENVADQVRVFSEKMPENDFPSDGLVLVYNDIAYGLSLGRTAKFPRDSIAFKWADEVEETVLVDVEWSPSRTGLINPIALFEPVELEGTRVSRASLHNLSILQELKLGIGDRITVYKANMIIPQIAENLTKSGSLPIPGRCPACGQKTMISEEGNTKTLVCVNRECPARQIKSLCLMTGRDALNIEGLSEATLEKFVGKGFIRDFSDIFHLDRHREEICAMEGFGEKSYQNLMDSIEKARETTMPRVIFSLGIPGIGLSGARLICSHLGETPEALENAGKSKLSEIPGVGEVLAGSWTGFFSEERNRDRFRSLLREVRVTESGHPAESGGTLEGKTFVITGSVTHFENRGDLKAFIEEKGGKVTGSVTSKTNYLINNDRQSSSSKNKKARTLGIPILSEEEFLRMAEEG